MSIVTSSNQTSQRSLIDDFFVKIEARRNAIIQAVDFTKGRKDNELGRISLIELFLGGLERELQDFHQEEQEDNYLVLTSDEIIDLFLQVGIDNLDVYPKQTTISYFLLFILSALKNRDKFSDQKDIKSEKIIRSLLYLKKIALTFKKIGFIDPGHSPNPIIHSDLPNIKTFFSYHEGHMQGFTSEEINNAIENIDNQHIANFRVKINEKLIVELKSDFETLDIFGLNALEISLATGIEEIREKIGFHNVYSIIDQLLIFDDNYQNSIWEMKIKLDNESNQFNASEFGKFVFVFSEAITSIGEIDVLIDNIGMGSVWMKFKVKIKSLASEIDFMQVMHQAALYIDATISHKSFTEIKKTDAETQKIKAETNKIIKDQILLPDVQVAKLRDHMDLYEKFLNLKKREQEIEMGEEDIKQKKLDTIKKASEVIGESVIELDSNIQMEINQMVFLSLDKKKSVMELGNINISEALKKLEPKGEISKEGEANIIS